MRTRNLALYCLLAAGCAAQSDRPDMASAEAETVAPAPRHGGDSGGGEELLRLQVCTNCHQLDGRGLRSASDLGNRVARDYSPSLLVSILWNHGRLGLERPRFSEQQVADLFAFAVARRYFERPGDAARGKRVFLSKRCSECHSVGAGPSRALPVATWTCLSDPVALAAEMWSHAPKMIAALGTRRIAWARLTSQEMTDLLVYLQNRPEQRGARVRLAAGPVDTGRQLFQAKGCAQCHGSGAPPRNLGPRLTAADFAAGMWNHQVKAAGGGPSLAREEMGALFGYLWSAQAFSDGGEARRGQRVFVKKGCSSCHGDAGDRRDAIAATAALWNHGPGMPVLTGAETADLLAYLGLPRPAESQLLAQRPGPR